MWDPPINQYYHLNPFKDNFAVGECNFLKLEDNLIIAYIDADEFEITIELDQPDVRNV